GGGALAAAVAVVALVATRPGQLGSTNPMETLAKAPAATTITAPIDLRAPIRPSPVLMNSDFAQPASYDTPLVPLPRYSSYDPEILNRYSPYLLQQSVSPPAQVLTNAAAAQPHPVQHQ
ncbi:MAG TPA: hypothetical protein VFN13_05590, partial [Rudaea sp.]|nr:hypothetical protein [Rudaea sp.]